MDPIQKQQILIVNLLKSGSKMDTVFKNDNGLLIMENMESYLQQKMPDCCLYSDDGYKFMIHKVNFSNLHYISASWFTVLPL